MPCDSALAGCDINVVLMNAIALLRLAIGSSEGRNNGTTSLESNCGNTAGDCEGITVARYVEEVNRIVEQLVKDVDDTRIDCCSMKDSCMC
ncbi:hypothetical protein Tco_1159792 [Tanacetum coccineum]